MDKDELQDVQDEILEYIGADFDVSTEQGRGQLLRSCADGMQVVMKTNGIHASNRLTEVMEAVKHDISDRQKLPRDVSKLNLLAIRTMMNDRRYYLVEPD